MIFRCSVSVLTAKYAAQNCDDKWKRSWQDMMINYVIDIDQIILFS